MSFRFLGVRSAAAALAALCGVLAITAFDGQYVAAAPTQLTVTRVTFQDSIPIALDGDMIGAPALKLVDQPEWQDLNADATPEKIQPAAYPSGATVRVSVEFKVDPVPNGNINNVSIAGDGGADWLRFQLNGQTLQAGEASATFLFSANAPLPAGVGFSNLRPVSWSAAGGALAAAAGATKHTLYVTLRNPLPTVARGYVAPPTTVWLTMLELSIVAKEQILDDQVTGAIWGGRFTGGLGAPPLIGPAPLFAQARLNPASGAVNPDRLLTYYDPDQPKLFGTHPVPPGCLPAEACCSIGTTAQILTAPSDPNPPNGGLRAAGQCSAWAELFRDALFTQGIGQVGVYRVASSVSDAFLVNNWDPNLANINLGLDPPAGDLVGVVGQGNADPPSLFGLHFINCYRTSTGAPAWYDPSYGNGPFGSQAEWEEASIFGFAIPNPVVKNDLTKQEMNFNITEGVDVCAVPVGGEAGLLGSAAPHTDATGASGGAPLVPIAAAVAAGVAAMAAGGWYAHRRRGRN